MIKPATIAKGIIIMPNSQPLPADIAALERAYAASMPCAPVAEACTATQDTHLMAHARLAHDHHVTQQLAAILAE
jgi:hypothetical protein